MNAPQTPATAPADPGAAKARRRKALISLAALVLAIPVFFDVGFIILVPIVYGFAQAAGLKPLRFGLPVAGCVQAWDPSARPVKFLTVRGA